MTSLPESYMPWKARELAATVSRPSHAITFDPPYTGWRCSCGRDGTGFSLLGDAAVAAGEHTFWAELRANSNHGIAMGLNAVFDGYAENVPLTTSSCPGCGYRHLRRASSWTVMNDGTIHARHACKNPAKCHQVFDVVVNGGSPRTRAVGDTWSPGPNELPFVWTGEAWAPMLDESHRCEAAWGWRRCDSYRGHRGGHAYGFGTPHNPNATSWPAE